MGYGDNRYGGDRSGNRDRWQTPDRDDQWGRERGSREGSGGTSWSRGQSGNMSSQDRDRGTNWGGGGSRDDDDRGFIERAAEGVRSWFSDDDDRERGGRDYGRERMSGGQGGDRNRSSESFGGGFGNQRGWGDDHFDRQRGQSGGFSAGGPERSRDEGYARGPTRSGYGGGGGGADTWGGSGFGGLDDVGRRFDRIDPGHVGAQGAHPMSSPVDGGYGGPGASYSRSSAIMSEAGGGQHGGIDPEARDRMLGRSGSRSGGQGYGSQSYGRGQTGSERFGGGERQGGQTYSGGSQSFRSGSIGGQGQHDPHYSEWRQRQIEQLDRDYEDYRREHQSKFEQDFGGWREKRQGQRQSLGRVTKHMEVLGSDGEHIGTVDKVRGDRVILTKSDPNAGGIHHSFPCSWVDNVEDKVTLNKTAEEAKRAWQDEDQNQALFETGSETGSQGSEGPHILNRSFSGTYKDRDE